MNAPAQQHVTDHDHAARQDADDHELPDPLSVKFIFDPHIIV